VRTDLAAAAVEGDETLHAAAVLDAMHDAHRLGLLPGGVP